MYLMYRYIAQLLFKSHLCKVLHVIDIESLGVYLGTPFLELLKDRLSFLCFSEFLLFEFNK